MLQGNLIESFVILLIVFINAFVGIMQESKASNSLKALKEMSSPTTKVIRDANLIQTPSNLIVVGDIIVLEAGDYVPADLRLIETINLKIDESPLTGESVSVQKNSDTVLSGDTIIADRINCAYMGTIVTYGRGKGVVVATGMETEIGSIAAMLNDTKEEPTPLQKKLDDLGKSIGKICIVVCAIVFILGYFRGDDLADSFMIAISLAVAAIPEGLTVIVTVILAIGMRNMVEINAIIKKLAAVETLGSTTVICSDKTGTLTQNKMTVVKIYDNDIDLKVTGRGYTSSGDILNEHDKTLTKNTKKLLEGAVLCNDAKYDSVNEKIIGDPTEGALVVAGHKVGYVMSELNKKYPRLDELPFDSDRKLMSTLHDIKGIKTMYIKGAPDQVIANSKFIYKSGEILPLTAQERDKIYEVNNKYAEEALRVLAIAFKQTPYLENEDNLVFVGLLGMIDPPREEAKEAIKVCKKAGITVKMITGDHKITATAIGKQLGIFTTNGAIEGKEIEVMSSQELENLVKTTNIFARVSPEHKVRLINALKANGEIVAMTGDGVNDAPSLKKSDIGIAMGITGTDVSKEASDMILTDDNFSTIVKAVEQGRTIYNNIRKVISYILSYNIGEVLVVFIAMIMGLPMPLLPIHLLSINLLTDSFPAFALGMEVNEKGVMDNPPRNPKDSLIDKGMRTSMIIQSIALAVGTLGAFILALNRFDHSVAITVAFATLVIGELLGAYSSKSETKYIYQMSLFSNKLLNKSVLFALIFLFVSIYTPLNVIFQNVPLTLGQVGIAVTFSIIPLLGGELSKYVRKIG
jgi:P-type Ca2+ transporter type 2C